MTRIGFLSPVACLVFGLFAAGPAAAQLDPRVAMPLQAMYNSAQMACQNGNPQGCGAMQQLQGTAQQLTQAQFACQQGNMQACQFFQSGAQQVMASWQQQQGQAGMAGGGQGYSSQQMTRDHDTRMRQQQQQFQQHQNQMQQQQRQSDDNHRRFMEQHRR